MGSDVRPLNVVKVQTEGKGKAECPLRNGLRLSQLQKSLKPVRAGLTGIPGQDKFVLAGA